MSFLNNPFASKNIVLICGDILIAVVSVYAGILLRFIGDNSFVEQPYDHVALRGFTFAICMVFMTFLMDLYSTEKGISRKEIFMRMLLAGLSAVLALGAFYYFVPSVKIGRGILFYSMFVSVTFQTIWHITYRGIIKMTANAKKVLIVGTGQTAHTLGTLLLSNNNGFALSGYINCIGEPVKVPDDHVIGNGDGLLDIATKEKVQKIVVSLAERRGTFPVREVLDCKLQGIDVVDGPSFYEQMTGKLLIENINPSHLIFSEGFKITVIGSHIKRLFDLCLSALGIIISLPVLLVITIIIKLSSKGPVLLKQTRVGEGERQFTLYKFRTMIDGAEKDTGPVWSQSGDKRITRIGKILRKTRLDEIPQLFNVIRGDMSFIGPRPERPFFVESLKKQIPYYSERHCIKPGITGWAQVRYEYGDSKQDALEKLRYDLYYIKYQSIILDILILLKTVKVVLFGRGGR